MNVLLINDKIDESILFHQEVYRNIASQVASVHRIESLRVELINAEGFEVFVGEESLSSFNIIHCLNFPSHSANYFDVHRNELYRYSEIECAFIAALNSMKAARIINREHTLTSAKHVFDKYSFIRKLNAIGWRTPRLESKFEFELDAGLTKTYHPEPDNSQLFHIALTKKRFSLNATNPIRDLLMTNLFFKAMIANTQTLMASHEVDICTIPFTITNGEIFVFGVEFSFPPDLKIETAVNLLKEIL